MPYEEDDRGYKGIIARLSVGWGRVGRPQRRSKRALGAGVIFKPCKRCALCSEN